MEILKKGLPIRLALRVEGEMVNCYIAAKGTMEGAFFIGSMPAAVAAVNPDLFADFKALMKNVMIETGKAVGITKMEFEEKAASLIEHSGNA